MPIINLPPVIDLNYYRLSYPELNYMPAPVLNEHCRRFAVEQGRSTCAYDRSEYLKRILQDVIDKNHLQALEISPWDSPFLRGDNVKYFEVKDAEELRSSTVNVKRNLDHLPKKIDFVDKNGDLGVINETFDIVFSAHVIEHCPDLVAHFRGVSKILKRGGLYVLIVPDKRFCFDYYHSDSTITEIIDAFVNKQKIPNLSSVINFAYTRTHNNAVLHWLGEHGARYGERKTPPSEGDAKAEIMGENFFDDGQTENREQVLRLIDKYKAAVENDAYISAHNWRFTPETFAYIMRMLKKLELIDLQLYRVCHTIWGRQEFITMLEKI